MQFKQEPFVHDPLQELFEAFAYKLERKFPRLDSHIRETVHMYAPSCSLDEVIIMLNCDLETLTEQELRDIKNCFKVVRLKAINIAVRCLGDAAPDLYLDWIKNTTPDESPEQKAHSFEKLFEKVQLTSGKGEKDG